MSNKKIIFCFAAACFLAFYLPLRGADKSAGEGGSNYLNIRRYYLKWDRGFEGSKGYFKKILYSYLVEMIGRDITTDYDYIPESYDRNTHKSRFRSGEWLVISGEVTGENIKEIDAFRNKYGRNSQPGKGLFSISGRIKKFRLSDFSEKRRVYLHLDDMKIKMAEVKAD
ncbi:MAG TPA: hypothetical protein P5120_08895 [Spirochaetota bacterium]|nr:hypothetical protein [Spirochaetota bacterium]HPJ42871.1 hypothetical protein [Spirochaetota bacterium]HPR37542.1 hypothetical protein [Spirochaetota bacterium]HRX47624.1 hypothetical protein [Spirochaetota bacterium]